MDKLRRIPVWGWLLIFVIAAAMMFGTRALVSTPESGIDVDGILVCDENGENCEPLSL